MGGPSSVGKLNRHCPNRFRNEGRSVSCSVLLNGTRTLSSVSWSRATHQPVVMGSSGHHSSPTNNPSTFSPSGYSTTKVRNVVSGNTNGSALGASVTAFRVSSSDDCITTIRRMGCSDKEVVLMILLLTKPDKPLQGLRRHGQSTHHPVVNFVQAFAKSFAPPRQKGQ